MTPLLSAIYPTFLIFNDFDDFMKIILTFHMTAAVILLDELCFSCRNATFDRKKALLYATLSSAFL